MAAGAALLHRPFCKQSFVLLREVYTGHTHAKSSFSVRHVAGLVLKRKLGHGLVCQTQKEESVGPNNIDDQQESSLKKLQGNYVRDDENFTDLDYKVDCHVEVISWRERRITASIMVEASPQRVWQVLTDYERLSEFVPNLVCSEKIPCPFPGRIWLLQRGMQRMMYWNIEAHVVLDLKEFPLLGELHFFMVDGDFKRYEGRWRLQIGPRPRTTLLQYEVNVVPKIIFPAAFFESIIKTDLPKNLHAIAKRAEAELDCQLAKIPEKHVPLHAVHSDAKVEVGQNASVGVADFQWTGFGRTCKLGNHCLVDEIHFRRLDDLFENGGVHWQVVASITVKASFKDVWSVLTKYEALPEFVPNLANSVVLSREGKRVRLLQEGCKCLLYMVLHARVVLDLWEQPEQEISFKQVEGDFDSLEGTWTLNQLGTQHTVLKYAVDTKIWKDCNLAESLVEEVIYEDLPSNLCAIRDRVESLTSGLSSPPVEVSENVSLPGEQVPSMCAKFELIDAEDSGTEAEEENMRDGSTQKDSPVGLPKRQVKDRARVTGLMNDYCVMEREIRDFVTAHGREGIMPMRKNLRQHGRSDLEKAIRAMGGFGTVAARMKLSLSYKERKPAGYWDDVRNLRNEVIAAQKETGCDPTVLPSRLSLERLGKYNLARALEKWGGAKETARILGLKSKASKKQECRHKERPPAKVSRLASTVKPLQPVVPTAPGNSIKDQGSLAVKRFLKADVLEGFSPESYLSSVASYIEKASELPSRKIVASSPISTTQGSQNALKATANNEDLVQTVNDSFSATQFKEKKMPYKTGVPQESSKWLTLFADDEQLDLAE